MRSIFRRKARRENKANNQQYQHPEDFSIELVKDLKMNLTNIKHMLDEPKDLIIREFTVGDVNHECAIVYIDGLVDIISVHDKILENLQVKEKFSEVPSVNNEAFDYIERELIAISDYERGNTLDDVSNGILSGHTVFFMNNISEVFIMDTKGGEFRGLSEPISETLIRGPRVGFVENLGTNISLLRRLIQDPNLKIKTYETGRRGKDRLAIAYMAGIIHPQILDEVNQRLESIDIDFVAESGYIEEWIEDSFLSPFPQLLNTERPDKVASALVQGKFAILLDGTPFVLIAPITLGNVLQSPEDYYERWTIGSLLRILRYLAAFISLFLPAVYIALVSFQTGMIPSLLVFSIAATREGVPFPAFIEALLMVITMELLQEAGARLPQTIGQTIGIVGGLVIGEAAVQAGIVSPIMVIVIALTAIATFAIPAYSVAISFRIIRFAFIAAAATLGLFGIILIYIMVNIHIVNLNSFGVPYSTPFAPAFKADWKDLIFRAPITTITKRPKYLEVDDEKKLDRGEK